MLIAVDAMGGDFAPEAVVGGVLAVARDVAGDIALVGPAERLEALLPRPRARPRNVRIVDAPQVIGMGEDPGRAVRSKPDSSLAVTVNLVRDGEADAAVSAGNSGAFMFLAQVRLRTMPGLQRPGIAVPLPGGGGPRILIDAGANVDCRPLHLAQFGMMGSIYAEHAWGCASPRVGLLSIGHEASKGDELTRAAHDLLRAAPLNFIGNVEGDQLFADGVDVVVADGFVGNVALKVTEGVGHTLLQFIKEALHSSPRYRLGAWLVRSALRQAMSKMDYANYGGALLLGVNGICVVGHGRSSARAVANAVRVAERAVLGGVRERMEEGLQRMAGLENGANSVGVSAG